MEINLHGTEKEIAALIEAWRKALQERQGECQSEEIPLKRIEATLRTMADSAKNDKPEA